MSSPDSLTSLDMSPSPEAVVPPSPTVKGASATAVLGRKPGVGGSDASSDLSELSSDGEAQRDHRQYKKPRHSSLDDLDGEEENSDQEDEDSELPSPQTASSSKRGPQSRKNGIIVTTRKPLQSRMRIKSSSSNNTTTTTMTTARRPQSPSKSTKARQQHHSPTFSKPNGAPASSYGKPSSRAPTHARHTRTKSESVAGGNGGASCAVAGPSSLNGHLNHPSAFAISAGLVGPTIGGDSDDDEDDILNGGRRSSRRNKRGVVPGPMWDWAIKKLHPNHSGVKKESSKSQKSNDDGHSSTNSPTVEDRKVSGAPDDPGLSLGGTRSMQDDEDVKPDLASLAEQQPHQGFLHASESTHAGPSTLGLQSRATAKGKRARHNDGDGPDGSSSSDSNMSLAAPSDPSKRRSNPKKSKSSRVPPSRSPSFPNGRSASPSAAVPSLPNLAVPSAPQDGSDEASVVNGEQHDVSLHRTLPSTSNSSAFSLSIPNSDDEDEPENDRKKAASQAPISSIISSGQELGGLSPKLAAKKRTPPRDLGLTGLEASALTTSIAPTTPQVLKARGSIPLPISPVVASGRPRGGSSLDLLADVIGTATGGARAGVDLHMSREVKEEAVMMEIEEAADHAQDTGKEKDANGNSMEVDAEDQEDAGAKEGRDDGEEQESEEDEPDPDAEADDVAAGRRGQNDDDEDEDPEDEEDGRRRRSNKLSLVIPDDNENGADDVEEEEENDLENRESDREDNGTASKHTNGNGVEKGDEVEEEVEAEHDHEVENEIQPTQRAEALEILAAMELKFAMLRQRIYLDKMHETAREEKMLLEGTHPEYLTLLAELQRRRDRKLNLSELRRTKEEEFATHQRKAEEQAVWRQWNETKDDVRDELVAEANAKRRRLEREKRHIDAPKAVRTVQMPPAPSRSRRPPSPQSLKQTLKAYAKQTKGIDYSSLPLFPSVSKAAPNLEPLSQRDAAMDLDLILGNSRRSSAATAVAVHHQSQQPLPLPVQHIHPQQAPPHTQQQVHQPHPQSHPHPQSQQQMMYAPPPPPNGYPPMHGYPHPQQQHGPPPHQRYMTPAGYGHPADYGSNGGGPYSHHPSMVQGGYVDGSGYDPYAPPGVQHYPSQPPPPAPQQHYPPPHPHPSQLPPPQQYHQPYHPQYAPQPPQPPHGQQYLHQPQPQRYILPPSDVALPPPPPPPGYPRHNWAPPHPGPPPPVNGPPNPNQNPGGREKVMIDLTNVPSPAPIQPHRSDQQQTDPSNRDRQRAPLMSPSRVLAEGGGPPPRPGSSLLAPIPTSHHDPRPPSTVSHFTSTPRPHRDQPPPPSTPGIQSAVSPFKQPLSPSREIPAPIGPGYPLQSPTRMATPASSAGGGVPRHSQSPNLVMRGPSTPLAHGLFNGTVDGPNPANAVPPPALSNGVVEGL